MALSYNDLGRVDLSPGTQGESGQKTDLRMVCADITVQQTDYVGTTGGVVPVGTNIGLNQVLWAHGVVRGSTGALDVTTILTWDATLSGLRGAEHPAAGSDVAFTEVTSADFANNDVIRVVAVGR